MRIEKTVVLDDDPTGIQTVHGNLLLTRWDRLNINNALSDEIPFFYILTNTRAIPPKEASALIDSIVSAVLDANQDSFNYDLTFISRSDSTLRSHFPLEIDQIQRVLNQHNIASINAFFLVPAFFEGGRVTRDDIHYLKVDDTLMRTDRTEFASDSIFGYPSSHLPSYIEYKSKGRIKKKDVKSLTLEMLRNWDEQHLAVWINKLETPGCWVVVNSENYDDMKKFCRIIRCQMAKGKRYLFQTAASFVKSFTQTTEKRLLDKAIALNRDPGIVIIGSHVQKSSDQLTYLLENTSTVGIEVDVGKILNSGEHLLSLVWTDIESAFRDGKSAVVYTSRQEAYFTNSQERLQAGHRISKFLTQVVSGLDIFPSFLVAKGGITSHDILVDGLGIESARVAGQILPGVSVVRLPDTHRWKHMPYIIFPGNVGATEDLAELVGLLRK